MRVIVTGADGFVGPYLCSRLEGSGNEVLRYGSKTGPNLLEPEQWVSAIKNDKPEVIFHLAGWSNVGSSWKDPVACFQVNAAGTLAVLDAARRAGTRRVIVISSAEVYKMANTTEPITESYPIEPASPYGLSKVASEAAAQQYWLGYGLETVIARPFNHIGVGQRDDFVVSAFANKVVALESEGGGVLRHGNLEAERDFTDVRDVVEAYELLATSGEPGEIYNICSSHGVSIKVLLETIVSLSKQPIETQADPDLFRPSDCRYRVGSADKLNKLTGWQPKYTLADTLAAILDQRRNIVATVAQAIPFNGDKKEN